MVKLKRKSIVPPIVFIGIGSCFLFYFLNAVKFFITGRILLSLTGGLFIVLIVLIFFKKKIKTIFKYWRGLVFTLIGFLAGVIAFSNLLVYESKIITLAELSKTSSITAKLTSEPVPAGEYYRFTAKLLNCKYPSNAVFSGCGNINLFIPKTVVNQNLSGGISRLKSDSENDCRIFVRGVVLTSEGRFSTTSTGPTAFFAKESLPQFQYWSSKLAMLRGHLRFHLMRLLYSWGSAGALLLALLSADKNFLSADVQSAFINSGLAHILALSGMHISIISTSSGRLGKFVSGKKFAAKISLFAILFFIWFAGSAPSLNRAIGMTVILLLGRALGLVPKNISVMCAMLVIHLLIKPQDALTLGFMLSYSALAGILLFGEAIEYILSGKLPKKIMQSFSASVGAQSFTSPIVTFFIGRIAVIGVISSSIISPIIALYLITGILFIFTAMLFPPLTFYLGEILRFFFNVILYIVNLFSAITPIQPDTFFASFMFALVPIILGILCMQYSKSIKSKRLIFAKTNL